MNFISPPLCSLTVRIPFRSLNGDGMFNYRMVFPFEYSEIKRSVIVMKKVGICHLKVSCASDIANISSALRRYSNFPKEEIYAQFRLRASRISDKLHRFARIDLLGSFYYFSCTLNLSIELLIICF